MSGIVLWVSALAVAAALAIGVGEVGLAAVDQAKAQVAADAAALAGAADGASAASQAAQRNGATLTSISVAGAVTTVVVQYGRADATAAAERLSIPIRN